MKAFQIVLLVLILGFYSNIKAQSIIWTKTDSSEAPTNPKNRIVRAKRFAFFKADIQALQNVLGQAVQEREVKGWDFPGVIELPMPDGTLKKFKFVESSIMEEALQRKFPEIRTYFGLGLDDPGSTVRFDFNPYFGFSGQIMGKRRILIDPFINGNIRYYQSYYADQYKEDVPMPPGLGCNGVIGEEIKKNGGGGPGTMAAPCRGNQIWNYRLAIGCTHQYAIAATGLPNPTKNEALAKIISTFSRVVQIYSIEFSISFTLVGNMDKIIFISAADDKYTANNNDNALLLESQTVITDSIGSANFDIGHTFSTGAGGLASLGVVCNNNFKAQGVTGRANPTGDAYDVDYVCHEIGHQFGGEHTFNNNTNGSCAGNRAASSAFEPGSASTIMGYAGICSPDNLQVNSDPYFHTHSFDQIISYINTSGGCKTITPRINNNPVITEMSDNGKTIPKETPFKLSAKAQDPDLNNITYCWEQMDLGPAGTMNSGANSTTAPLFRSVNPSSDPVRRFPSIDNILTLNTKGETLPKVAREMKFRLTVRDGVGGVATGGDGCSVAPIFKINVAANGPFNVTQPNTNGVVWKMKSCQKVKWNTAGTASPPVNCQKVKILLSVDCGLTFSFVLAENTDNDGSESIIVPEIESACCRIMIEAADNIFFDINEKEFSILGSYDPDLKVDVTDASGCDKKDGKAKLTVLNPLPGMSYKYSIDDGPLVSSSSFSNLAPGGHTAFAFHADSTCPIAKGFEIKNKFGPVSLRISGTGTTEFCNGNKPPTIRVTASASGGSGQYSYSPANATRTFTGRTNNATASFSVTDKITGCKANASGQVSIVEIICSRDPNDIIGPAGYGDSKMVSKFVQWPYKIRFENDPNFATAPAQIVKINMPVDPNLNLFSFRLSDFGFGNFNFTVPPNKTSYATRLNLVDSLGIVVDVTAGIDVAKREFFWIFESKDPTTGLPPADPFKGFLPVNDSVSKKGEGYVSFTVRPANSTITGDSVKAKANIVFDINEAILTPEIFNSIDAAPPATVVKPLAAIQDSTGFFVRFTGADDTGGSGLTSFDLYVSENNGPFSLNEEAISDSITRFNGIPGNTYRFFTLGNDRTGNKEPMKNAAEQTTAVRNIVPKPSLGPDIITTKCTGASLDLTSFFDLIGFNQEWSTPTPGEQILPGTFVIIATNANGDRDTASVTVQDVARPNLGQDQTISLCPGTSINITGFFGADTFPQVQWSTPRPDSVVGGNTYTVVVRNSSGCADTASVTILPESNIPVPVISFSGTNPFCLGDTLVLQSSATLGNLWSNGATSSTIKVFNAGTISLRTVSGACTSDVSNPVVLQVINPGSATVSPDGGTFAGQASISIAPSGPGEIFYTLNGSDPVPGAPNTLVYSAPFNINQSLTLKTRVVSFGCKGIISTKSFVINQVSQKVQTPVIAPPTGTYSGTQTVSISCATPDAVIFYTTNGNLPQLSVPNSFTFSYNGPFQIQQSRTIRAIATKQGMTNSNIAISVVSITNPSVCATPQITPGTGTYSSVQTVSISTTTPDAEIFYSTNGNVPRFDVPNSFTKAYTGPFQISQTTTILAVARKPGFQNSSAKQAILTFSGPASVGAVVFSPAPGTYPGPQIISLSTSPADAQIYFTTNGNNPRLDVFNWFTKLYSTPINLGSSTVIRAQGIKSGLSNGPVSIGNYTISGLGAALANNLKLSVYPNPTENRFNLMVENVSEGWIITSVTDVLGREVLQTVFDAAEGGKEIDLSVFPPGIYTVKVRQDHLTGFIRMVKE